MNKEKQNWLTRKQFTAAYTERWKLPASPSQTTIQRWCETIFKPKRLARILKNPFVASGSSWEISARALEIPPPKAGPPFKKSHKKQPA